MWTVIFGGVGLLIAKLLFEPSKETIGLRRDAQECLIACGDLPKDAAPAE